MTNSKQEYNDFVRANLPGSIRYDSVRNRYVTANGKYFVTYKEAKWYVDYLTKFGTPIEYYESGIAPNLVLDYSSSTVFKTPSFQNSFDDVVTATRTGLATQLDASGNLVWNAHNLLRYSEDFSNAVWQNVGTTPTVTSNVGTAPDGTLTADRLQLDGTDIIFQAASSVISGLNGTFAVWVKSNTGTDQKFRFLVDGATKADQTATSEWQLFSDSSEDFTGSRNCGIDVASTGESADLLVWGAHVYRSDLGGMAPVPLTRRVAGSTTYVPTTSAAVYLPREEAYAYVSGSLVGPYYQKESDARTNSLLDSGNPTTANWSVKTTTATQNAVGLWGEANTAWTLEDDDSAAYELNRQIVTLANDSSTHTAQIFVAKDNDETRFPEFQFSFHGGTEINHFVSINTKTGAKYSRVNDNSDTSYVEDWGNFWRVVISATNNTSGNTSAYFTVLPAVFSSFGGAPSVGNTGSIVYAGGQVELNTSTPTSYIPTSGSTVTRSADSTTIAAGNMPYPTPQVIGPELVDDFTLFAQTVSKTGTSTGSLSFVDGLLTISRLTEDTAAGWLDAALVSTSVYEVSYRVVSGTAVFAAGSQFTGQVPGSYSRIVTGGPGVRFWSQSTNSTIVVDNISVREINPLALSFQLEGLVTYADTNSVVQVVFGNWRLSAFDKIEHVLNTGGVKTGNMYFSQTASGVTDTVGFGGVDQYSPGINVPFNIASRHGSTFINGAVDGTALTANTTPTALPDLSVTTFDLAPTFNGFIKEFRVWADDIGDTGIAEAST